MKLNKIVENLNFYPWNKKNSLSSEIEITSVEIDSRKVRPGCIFVCLKGLSFDGHDFIDDVVKKGAATIVCESAPDIEYEEIPFLLTEDTRSALSLISSNFYGNPEKKLKIIGVTGTKGKTSVTYYLYEIFKAANINAGIIGTTGAFLNGNPVDVKFETSSTPDTIQLYEILSLMALGRAEYVIMEATSHGLDQKRLMGLSFEVGIFTNLSRDHLDYHKSYSNYVKAKSRLFKQCKVGVINKDNEYYKELLETVLCSIKFYGIENGQDGYIAKNVVLNPNGSSFELQNHKFTLNVPGRFSLYNALAVIATAFELGIGAECIKTAVSSISGVPGRLEKIENEIGICVIVDYAHTPDSLKNVLQTVREFTKGRIITLFGCGGDRDSGKRPLMGEISGKLSDFCIVTSDNPRNEKPEDIISQILPGINKTSCPYIVDADRESAIFKAIKEAKSKDTVVIAGKGHETYQEFENRRKIHFDDRIVAKNALNEKASKERTFL